MTDSTFVQVVWTFLIVFGFLLMLVVPSLVIESRWAREWIRRVQDIERGRAHQRAEYIEKACYFQRDVK